MLSATAASYSILARRGGEGGRAGVGEGGVGVGEGQVGGVARHSATGGFFPMVICQPTMIGRS